MAQEKVPVGTKEEPYIMPCGSGAREPQRQQAVVLRLDSSTVWGTRSSPSPRAL